MTVALIELGDLGAEPAPLPTPRPGHRLSRRVGAALVVLLCLATLAASIPPTARGLRVQWSLADSGPGYFTIVGDSVVVTGGPLSHTLTSYGIADGKQRWSHELSDEVPYVNATRDSRVLLLPANAKTVTDTEENTILGYYSDTIALDAATGAELWRSTGNGEGWAGLGMGVLEERSRDAASTARLRVVRLADGSTVWGRETPGVDRWLTLGADPARPDRIALIARSGKVRILRLADGAELSSGSVRWEASAPTSNSYTDPFTDGDDLYVLRSTLERTIVTAYSQEGLRRRWQIEQLSAGSGAYSCGPVLCVGSQDGLIGYDWSSGAVRWRAPGQQSALPISPELLLTQTEDPGAHEMVLEAASGRRLADLGDDSRPWAFDANTLIVLGFTQSMPTRTVVNNVNLRTGEVSPLGTIDAVGDSGCQLAGKLLLCSHPQGRLTVTAVG